MLDGLMQFMYKMVVDLGNAILSLLPQSPFREFIDSWQQPQYLGWLNWFIPVGQIISILAIWLISISLFYVLSIAMRWTKMIGD